MTRNIKFVDMPTSALTESEWQLAAELFSNYYGIWSETGVSPGNRIRLSKMRLKQQCGFDKNCRVVLAQKILDKGSPLLIGQAFYTRKYDVDFGGYILWITQLVVDAAHRGKKIAATLCNITCGSRDIFAGGLVSSHPYAVKALEKALNMPVDISTAKSYAPQLISKLEIPYLSPSQIDIIDSEDNSEVKCVCHTEFYADHTEVNLIRDSLSTWTLGALSDGDEYLAVIVTGVQTSRKTFEIT